MKQTFIFSLAVLAITSLVAQNKELTLSDAMLNRKLYPEQLPAAQWIPGTEKLSYCSADYQTLMVADVTGKKDTLVTLATINGKMKERIKIPGLWMVQWIDATTLYFEAAGKGFAYNLQTEALATLYAFEAGAANQDAHLKSGQAAFTVDNNLYITTKDGPLAVTQHASKTIVAGQTIARNEYGISKGTFWSPNGTLLAFYEKDETNVADYPLLDITTTPGSLKNIKYPMAGQQSEIARVGIYNPATRQTVYLKSTKAPDDYMTNLGWDPTEKYVYVAELNRATNHMKLNKYNAVSGEFIATLFEEKNDKWVEPERPIYFANGTTDRFVWHSERDGFMNLYLYTTEGKLLKQLTANTWVTLDILSDDGKNLYTLGTGANPTEKHLFKVDLKSGKQVQLTTLPGTHSPQVSTSGNHFFSQHSSSTLPGMAAIYSTSTKKETAKLLVATNPLADYGLTLPEIFTLKSADGATDLYARMFKPANFDPTKKYPVVVYVYGGPHAQMVTNSWNAGAPLWMNYMAQRGYLVFTVDNRGSGNRGFAFESVIHRNAGDAELEDQEAGVNYLKSLPFVNAERLAVHGWSYGGFMTTSLMLRKPDLFKVGVAGGPVTDWKWYEVMYGERYMDTPEENPEGYKKAEVAGYVKNLKGDLLLIHGTVDDVVVMQHNLALVKAFVDAGIQVDFFPYPMHPHNVRGKDRLHLMTKVLDYIEESLAE
jgi:dipeptidyl-peptidase-4